MPPCEALTTTAPRASASAMRVMLSATAIGAGEPGMEGSQRGRSKIASSRPFGASAPCTCQIFAGTMALITGPALRFRSRSVEEGGGAILDLALDRTCEEMQEARQFEVDSDEILVDLDAACDCLHQRDDLEIQAVLVPGIVERLHIGRDLGPDLGEALVNAAFGSVAPEPVRDRDGDRFGRGLHVTETPGLPITLPPGLIWVAWGSKRERSLPNAELKVRSEIAGSVWKIE